MQVPCKLLGFRGEGFPGCLNDTLAGGQKSGSLGAAPGPAHCDFAYLALRDGLSRVHRSRVFAVEVTEQRDGALGPGRGLARAGVAASRKTELPQPCLDGARVW